MSSLFTFLWTLQHCFPLLFAFYKLTHCTWQFLRGNTYIHHLVKYVIFTPLSWSSKRIRWLRGFCIHIILNILNTYYERDREREREGGRWQKHEKMSNWKYAVTGDRYRVVNKSFYFCKFMYTCGHGVPWQMTAGHGAFVWEWMVCSLNEYEWGSWRECMRN